MKHFPKLLETINKIVVLSNRNNDDNNSNKNLTMTVMVLYGLSLKNLKNIIQYSSLEAIYAHLKKN